jgi:hypothetical protein
MCSASIATVVTMRESSNRSTRLAVGERSWLSPPPAANAPDAKAVVPPQFGLFDLGQRSGEHVERVQPVAQQLPFWQQVQVGELDEGVPRDHPSIVGGARERGQGS